MCHQSLIWLRCSCNISPFEIYQYLLIKLWQLLSSFQKKCRHQRSMKPFRVVILNYCMSTWHCWHTPVMASSLQELVTELPSYFVWDSPYCVPKNIRKCVTVTFILYWEDLDWNQKCSLQYITGLGMFSGSNHTYPATSPVLTFSTTSRHLAAALIRI